MVDMDMMDMDMVDTDMVDRVDIFQGCIFSRYEYFFSGEYFLGVNIFQGLKFFRGEYFQGWIISRSEFF